MTSSILFDNHSPKLINQQQYSGQEINLAPLSVDNEQRDDSFPKTNDGSVDRHGRPAIRRSSGGWTSGVLLLVNQGFSQLAFFGLAVNLVLFLRRVLDQGNAVAANNVSKWTGTVYLFSLTGAFLSDSYWGRYWACTIFQIILLLGLVLLSLASWLLLIKPSGCGDGDKECIPASSAGAGVFYLAIYLVALGNGGNQPSIATFGADQFDETHPKEQHSKVAFFSYFYLALNLGSLFSNTFLVYIEDGGKWVLGFWIAAACGGFAIILLFAGTPRYRHFRPSGNPLTRVAQVIVAMARKWDVEVPDNDQELHELEGSESISGSKKIPHTNAFSFLDKAATVIEDDFSNPNKWRLVTVTQVEEVKCVLKLIPIWLCTIIYSVVFTQMASLFVEQGDAMDLSVGSFRIPPASMSAFDIISVSIFIFLYQKVLTPVAGRITGNPKGISELQRMGVGLIIGMLAMVCAGFVEIERRKRVENEEEMSSLSIFWQVPQYALIGASEVFMYVGQLEFFHGEAPDGIKSFGSSLCMASISLGNYVSCILVTIVMKITTRGGEDGWIPENLNVGHLERFFFLLAALSAVDLVVYIFLARWYKFIPNKDDEEKDIKVELTGMA